MATEATQQAAPAPGAPNQAQPPSQPPAESIQLTPESLKVRLEREREKGGLELVKSLGFESFDALKAWKTDADKTAKAADERKRAEMAEIDRYKADLAAAQQAAAAADAKAKAAEAAAANAATQSRRLELLASKGVSNLRYGLFCLEQARASNPEVDEGKALDELIAKASEKAALGVAAPPPVAQLAQTAPTPVGPAPNPAGARPAFDASTATPEQWLARKRELGLA